MEKIQETFNKDLEELKGKQTMMNNAINEIKNSLEGITNRITDAEERISDLEDKILEITTTDREKVFASHKTYKGSIIYKDLL